MPTVLHVLPHRGGGAETYIDLLEGLSGYRHERLPLSSGRTPLAAAGSLPLHYPALLRARRHADLMHVHGDAAALLTLPLLGRSPAVWTTHGLHLLRRRPAVAAGIRGVITRAKVTICTSQAEADELAALAGGMLEYLVVVPNGVPLPDPSDHDRTLATRAAMRAELGLADTDVAALFLGQLEERKRPLDAILAAERARTEGAPITLLLAGAGPLAARAEEHSGPAVRVLGFREDPARLLAAADIFVLPSAREGHSFALLEAMACALPVLVADGPGSAEALAGAGVILPTGDLDALSRALAELARDPARRAALGAAARERVARELTPAQLREGVRRAYERALREPGRAPGDEHA